jgi:hypothetical protein
MLNMRGSMTTNAERGGGWGPGGDLVRRLIGSLEGAIQLAQVWEAEVVKAE